MTIEQDLYYDDYYIELYLKQGESLFHFEYKEKENFFLNKAIKRPIEKVGNEKLEIVYYDLETVYGYGGFYVNTDDQSFVTRAWKAYINKCYEEKVIAEFIRFHPWNDFPLKYHTFLNFCTVDREVVVKDIKTDIMKSYRSKTRNIVKKALEKVHIQESQDIYTFQMLYTKTMQKNNASSFYYFNTEYFKTLLNHKAVKLYEAIYKGDTVSMSFFIFGKEIVYYHLSANSELSYRINANYALLHYVFEDAKRYDKQYVLLGGGSSSDKDDSLFKFKKKFSSLYKPFYIAGKIYNQELYEQYMALWHKQSRQQNIPFFLKYRLEIA